MPRPSFRNIIIDEQNLFVTEANQKTLQKYNQELKAFSQSTAIQHKTDIIASKLIHALLLESKINNQFLKNPVSLQSKSSLFSREKPKNQQTEAQKPEAVTTTPKAAR